MRHALDEYNTRPSALTPVWALAGRILGGATALMGEKSAMACTEAVETVIGEHYDEYVHYELTFQPVASFGANGRNVVARIPRQAS